ncbi:MAG: SpoIIE family protein phosphatase [Cyanobacteria bacterium P01_F01_bin.150]
MAQSGDEKLKLLIVDDEADNLDLLYRIFRQQFHVFRADSAFNALDILEQHGEMAIIISDQRMPRMKGTELLRRTVEPFPDTIRIVLTGYTDVEDLVEAINTGQVFKYITKPWKTPDLQSVVKQASETYRAIKQRTNALRRALRRESVSNSITLAIRESLDFHQILHSIAKTFGQTFAAEISLLIPHEVVSSYQGISTTSSDYVCYRRFRPDHEMHEDRNCPLHLYFNADIVEVAEQVSTIHQQVISLPIAREKREEGENSPPESQSSGDMTSEAASDAYNQLIIPLKYQHTPLAYLVLMKPVSSAWDGDDIDLIGLVTEQAALAIAQTKLHQQIQAQTERMQAELSVARQIQTNLLRQQWNAPENIKVQARCLPAQEVGGDFFEVYIHPQGQIWLAVGDVSGKGVPAALLMASAISVLRRELSQEHPSDPDIIMRNLNSSLMDSLIGSNCFITMVLACYTLSTNELVYANAGHIYPMVWSKLDVENNLALPLDERPPLDPIYLKQRGVPLGIVPNWLFSSGALRLKPGDVFLLSSDGLTEATVPAQLLAHSPSSSSFIESSPSPTTPASKVTDSPMPQDEFVMLRQNGLWQLLVRECGVPNIDGILKTLNVAHTLQEDDQTILSMEIL